ncbi:MAG TPA: hypothetical protein VNL71_12550 [Chloroflexota bacterium]|nr:hypothetical protein [Chloroflexota bacterium]
MVCRTLTDLSEPETIRMIEEIESTLSGNGGNTAAALARLGVQVDLAGYYGADLIGAQFSSLGQMMCPQSAPHQWPKWTAGIDTGYGGRMTQARHQARGARPLPMRSSAVAVTGRQAEGSAIGMEVGALIRVRQ